MNTQVQATNRGRCRSSRGQCGFTLVELMTVLTVMVILLALAVPSLSAFVTSSRINGLQSELVASLVLARSEATRRGVPVGLIASVVPSDSKPEFSGGWKVWVDSNADAVLDAGETVIREYPAPGSGISVGTGGVAQLRFGANGFVLPAAAVNFTVCAASGTRTGYLVRLEPVGLVDVQDRRTCP